MRKVAIIDLGTNTFNLLIAAVNGDGTYQILHNSKLPAKLGEGGIEQKVIAPNAFQRGISAFGEHFRSILLHGVSETYAFATSAIRNASNGDAFVGDIKNLFGIDVKVIDGQEEAELIYLGVRQAVELNDQNVLILDIGGGSNEIIIGNNKAYHWKRSYDLGISRLLQQFSPSDPITMSEIEAVEEYIDSQLIDLAEPIAKFSPQMIIGCSGSFDTYRSVLTASNVIQSNGNPSIEIPINQYLNLHKHLITTSRQQRNDIPGMDSMRVEMIVLASIFTNFLVNKFKFNRMLQSSYSLKEGAIWKIVTNC
jgi:exopolyphosphatase / guanosine-5'-triphosphate,3'-diphosphate pyrophosphatase